MSTPFTPLSYEMINQDILYPLFPAYDKLYISQMVNKLTKHDGRLCTAFERSKDIPVLWWLQSFKSIRKLMDECNRHYYDYNKFKYITFKEALRAAMIDKLLQVAPKDLESDLHLLYAVGCNQRSWKQGMLIDKKPYGFKPYTRTEVLDLLYHAGNVENHAAFIQSLAVWESNRRHANYLASPYNMPIFRTLMRFAPVVKALNRVNREMANERTDIAHFNTIPELCMQFNHEVFKAVQLTPAPKLLRMVHANADLIVNGESK